MRKLLPVLSLMTAPLFGIGQDYSFSPSDNYNAVLPMEQYSVHQVNIFPADGQDTTFMSWRIVGNTIPEEWDITLCDWAACFSDMPTSGDMDTIFPGQHGLIKLTVNPFDIPGSGEIHFWVFPTGQMDLRQDLFFTFSSEVVSVPETISPAWSIYPQPSEGILWIENSSSPVEIFDLTGKRVYINTTPGPRERVDLGPYGPGIYFARSGGKTIRILIQ